MCVKNTDDETHALLCILFCDGILYNEIIDIFVGATKVRDSSTVDKKKYTFK